MKRKHYTTIDKNGVRPKWSKYALKTTLMVTATDMAARMAKAATTEEVLTILNHAVDWPTRCEAYRIVSAAASARCRELPRPAPSTLTIGPLGAADFTGTVRHWTQNV